MSVPSGQTGQIGIDESVHRLQHVFPRQTEQAAKE